MKKKINIAIAGASGLTGTELVKLLLGHPYAQLEHISSRTYKGQEIGAVYPGIESRLAFTERIGPSQLKQTDVLFLCLPPHDSMHYLKEVLAGYGGMVIDVGSDFRIRDPEEYQKWYGAKHLLPEILDRFVYGLPEINSQRIKGAKYIANPGCYPTSVLLGVYPLLDSGLVDIDSLMVDSKSGVSGAGRKCKDPYLFIHLNENFYAYSPEGHRHIGEMEQEIESIYKKRVVVSFTPHLLPLSRGIFSTIYVKAKNIDAGLQALYEKYYGQCFFVNYSRAVPQIRDVAGTNHCLICARHDRRAGVLKVFVAIDNLVKGAAGQAVQNMNIALGFAEQEGLKLQGIHT